jgi:hypothetical protein
VVKYCAKTISFPLEEGMCLFLVRPRQALGLIQAMSTGVKKSEREAAY